MQASRIARAFGYSRWYARHDPQKWRINYEERISQLRQNFEEDKRRLYAAFKAEEWKHLFAIPEYDSGIEDSEEEEDWVFIFVITTTLGLTATSFWRARHVQRAVITI